MAKIEVKSEITGTVWKLKAKPGDKLEGGDTLLLIESMKMEIPVITEDGGARTRYWRSQPSAGSAPWPPFPQPGVPLTCHGGTVKEILVKENDPVAEGQVVAILED